MSKKIFLFLCLISFFSNFIIGQFDFQYRFYITGIVNFALSYYLLTKNPFKFYGWIFIFSLFFIINGMALMSLFDKDSGFIAMPLVLIYNLSSLFAICLYCLNNNKKLILISYLLIYIFLSFNFHNINNFYFSKLYKNDLVDTFIPEIEVKSIDGKSFNLSDKKQILVIDLWSNSCGYCIQAFPKFEEVYKRYINDKDVKVFSINVDEREPNRLRGNSFVDNFSFENYFATNDILKKLNFNKFPNYMIIGKDGKIKYFGSLNINELETYNNIYELIENER